MARWKALLLFGLVLTACLIHVHGDGDDEADAEAEDDDDYADAVEADKAHLIVWKHVKDEFGVVGRNLTVDIEVYNAGASDAYNVELVDGELPDGLELLEGTTKASLGKIEVGSSVKKSYVLLAKEGKHMYTLAPAKATYIAEVDGKEPQVGHSSRPRFYVMTPAQQIERHLLRAGVWASFGMARTTAHWRNLAILLVVIASAVGINQAVRSVGVARTTKKRKQALASLEKDD